MKLSREEFCIKFDLSEEQFFGRELVNKLFLDLQAVEYFPEGCSLECSNHIWLDSLKELPEGCSLKGVYINLRSLRVLPEKYLIDARNVSCRIILPSFKDSPEFYFGYTSEKRSFEKYSYIKENPLKYLRSTNPLRVALVEYFLKNQRENL